MRIPVLFVAFALPLAAIASFESPLRIRPLAASTRAEVERPNARAFSADEIPRRLDLVAREYGYVGPSRVAAGRRVISLRNEGKALHHVQLVQLTDGRQVSDLVAALNRNPQITKLPRWATPVGGPSAALPGATIESEALLSAGRYVVICWIPNADGAPHFMMGMMMPFDVVDTGREPAPATGLLSSVMVREYGFSFHPPSTPGRRTLRVRNIGTQPHEFLVVRLHPGASVEQVAAWSEKGQVGAPPVAQWVGVAALAPGKSAQLTVDFEPGRYAVFCLSPDRGDGRTHLEHGMHRTFEISGP